KFTPVGGGIRVTAAAVAAAGFTIAVADTGVGIAPEDQPRVFDEFAQVGASARTGQGTGLGLALVRGFVRMMGGEIALRSEPGVGSTFTVRLPLAQPAG
ncbi:MAG: ATP-binding protein, partial [Chloroflexota bacterium]